MVKVNNFANGPGAPATAGSSGGGATGSPAGGDLGGTIPNPTVTGLQGVPICTDTPTTDDVLTFNGTEWCPAPGGGGGATGGVFDVAQEDGQAKRYLMRDGSWRNPLLVGTGTLTVGSITTITDDTKYNAWPTVCRMRNGTLLLAYTKGDSHHADTTGVAKCKVGTEGLNGSISWGSEITIYDDSTLWTTVQAISTSSTGRVFAALWRDNPSSAGSGEAGVVYSDDYGVTWSAWIDLTAAFAQESFSAGPVLELGNGDLLVTIEGTDSGTLANRSSRTMRSTDQGATWGSVVTIRLYATDTRPYYETRLVLLDNDTLLAVHRCSAGASPGTHYISTSTDGGLTWGAPVLQFSGYGSPDTIQLSTGTLIACTRRTSDASAIVYTSTDRGVTWSSLVVLDATMNEMEYGCPIELLDGRILVVYGYQPSSATTNSDIKQVYVTETLTTIGTLTFATPAIVLGTAAAAGAASTVIRSDSTIVAFDVTVPTTEAFGDAAATGSAAVAARRDHLHGMPTTADVVAAVGPQHAHVNNVVFSGDGATTVFILPAGAVDAYSIAVYVTGSRSQDWTLSGGIFDMLTFGSAPASAANNIVIDITAAFA